MIDANAVPEGSFVHVSEAKNGPEASTNLTKLDSEKIDRILMVERMLQEDSTLS